MCLGSGFGCTPPLLAGVLGCVCAGVGAPLATRHSWLGCAPWVCVFGLAFRLRPATPGWGVGLCVCWCGRSACTPPLLAWVRAVGVCVWARVSAATRHSWLGCWALCVLVWALRLHPATPGWSARRGCVCLGSGFGCAPPLLAGVLGCVCARVRAPLVPRHSWLGCAVWVFVFELGFRLRPATPGPGVGVCVCWCACSSCTPPLLAGVRAVGVCVWARVSAAPRHSWLGCWAVCAGVGAPLAPCHSWLGCAVWVCVFGLGFRLPPATPGWAVHCGCVCSGSGFGCAPPLLAGVCGVWVGCCLAPVGVPWVVACCVRSPDLWHPAAVAAWHLSVCLGCGRQRASLACLVAPRGAPRLVRSCRSRCSGRLSRCRGAFPHPGGLRPRLYWAAARGTRRPAENRALCACRWPPPRRGRWARSASYPFGAPRWGCPWRVPPALVLGCVRCGGWRVWTPSLTRPVSRTVRRSMGDSAGAPGLFCVDADTAPCASEGATPGSRACVRVLALLGRVGRAGLPGAFRCASPFLLAALAFCFAWPPPGWSCPRLGPFFFPFAVFRAPPLSPAFFGFRPRVPWALALCVVCLVGLALLGPPCALALFVLPAWLLVVAWWLPASHPPLLCLAVFLAAAPFLVFFFSLVRAPVVSRFLWFPAPVALGLGAVLCGFFSSRLSALRALSLFFSRLAVGCSLVLGAPPPTSFVSGWFCRCRSLPPPVFFSFPACAPVVFGFLWFPAPGALGLGAVFCLLCGPPASRLPVRSLLFLCLTSPLVAPWWLLPPPTPCRLVLRSFFFCVVRPRCLRLSLVSGPGCLGPRRCALFALLASRFSALRAFSPLLCLPSGRSLLPGGCCPPPPFVSRSFRRFRSVLCAVFCAVLCVPGCGAALRCCALCRPLLCCCVLCCFAALGWCRCSSCHALWCSPSPWGPVLCGAVFCGVPPRCVCFVVAWWCVRLFAALLCAVWVLGCCAVCYLSSPLCVMLCFAVLVRLRCAVRVVRAVASARCCGALPCAVLFPLVCCGAVLGLVAPGCLLVPCCGALLSVFLCWWCWLVSFPCVCGAVLHCVSCCSVLVESALLSVPRAVACPCVLWCLLGRSAVWWCCSGVSWCLAVLCVVLWCPAPCAVSCGAVLPCGVVLVGCAVRSSALLVFVFPFVLFSFAKNPCCFSVPLKTF